MPNSAVRSWKKARSEGNEVMATVGSTLGGFASSDTQSDFEPDNGFDLVSEVAMAGGASA